MKVLKFGGTSVGSAERMQNVVRLISDGEPKIVVLSAMSGTTNSLIEFTNYLRNGNVNGAMVAVVATVSSGITGTYVTSIDANYLFGYAITGIPAGTYTFSIVPVATKNDGTVVKGETATLTVTIQE